MCGEFPCSSAPTGASGAVSCPAAVPWEMPDETHWKQTHTTRVPGWAGTGHCCGEAHSAGAPSLALTGQWVTATHHPLLQPFLGPHLVWWWGPCWLLSRDPSAVGGGCALPVDTGAASAAGVFGELTRGGGEGGPCLGLSWGRGPGQTVSALALHVDHITHPTSYPSTSRGPFTGPPPLYPSIFMGPSFPPTPLIPFCL